MKQILILGGGSIGERHLRCFQQTGRAEVALCDTNAELRERLTRDYGLARVFSTFEEALSVSFDAAVICTPAHLHLPMALELARRDTHLLIEKPLSTATDGAEELIAVVEERALTAAVAYVYRAHPALADMRRAIEAGKIGKPVQLVVTAGQHFPLYRPAYRDIYYARRETGGGAIQDALTHLVNASEWLVGPVTRLVADAAHCVLPGVDVEDTVHVITQHGSLQGCLSLNQHQPPNESQLTVIGDQGAARFEMHAHRWLSGLEPGEPWREETRYELQRDDLFIRQASAFLDAVEGTAPVACPLADALQTLHVNLAILRSVEQECWIDVVQQGGR